MKKIEKLRLGSPKIIDEGLPKKQLSNMNLVALVGGYGECGQNTCPADACVGWVCGTDNCLGNVCGGDACAGAACGGNVCGANVCPIELCVVDVCGVDACWPVDVFAVGQGGTV
jgi:hypothetical protein